MYTPTQFREERPDVLAAAIRDITLAALVTSGPDGPAVTHLPMVLKHEAGGWLLEGHVARANPHWRLVDAPLPSVAIFQGPQAYVSPGYYASKREHGKVVPTWNYVAVHAHGPLSRIDDGGWLASHLNDLTTLNEAGQAHPWSIADAPADYIAQMVRAIVGLRLAVSRLEGSWKMIQHRSAGDRAGTIAGLSRSGKAGAADVAAVMDRLERARGTA